MSPNAVVEFQKYRKNTLIATGFSLVGAGLIIATPSLRNNQEIVLLTGLGMAIGSGILFRDAGNNLNKSIWWYNRDILGGWK